MAFHILMGLLFVVFLLVRQPSIAAGWAVGYVLGLLLGARA